MPCLVNHAVPLAAEDAEQGCAGCRFVENGTDEIDEALRLDPFPIKSRLQEFGRRHQVRNRDGLIDLREKMSTRSRIKRHIFIEIELCVMWVNSNHVLNAALLIGHVLGKERRPGAADEMCRPFNDTFPQRLIENGVVNVADEIARL